MARENTVSGKHAGSGTIEAVVHPFANRTDHPSSAGRYSAESAGTATAGVVGVCENSGTGLDSIGTDSRPAASHFFMTDSGVRGGAPGGEGFTAGPFHTPG
jgi:hypothetical protein